MKKITIESLLKKDGRLIEKKKKRVKKTIPRLTKQLRKGQYHLVDIDTQIPKVIELIYVEKQDA